MNAMELIEFLIEGKSDIEDIDVSKSRQVINRYDDGEPKQSVEVFNISVRVEKRVFHGRPIRISLV